MADIILGILKRAIEARHPIQNKFARLHGRIIEIKEKKKRVFAHENALNFTGSISPIRVPEFEVDLGQLSRISSPPAGIEELERKYFNIEEISRIIEDKGEGEDDNIIMSYEAESAAYAFNESYYSIDGSVVKIQEPPNTPKKANLNLNLDENNFPAVISPMKRPHKEIDAEGKGNDNIKRFVDGI